MLVEGTAGNDRFKNNGNNSFIWGDEGDDTILSTTSDVTISGGAGNDSITLGLANFALVRNSISGGEGDDTIGVFSVPTNQPYITLKNVDNSTVFNVNGNFYTPRGNSLRSMFKGIS